MDALNEDCLQHIFEYLSFKDQISVLRGNKHFVHVIRRIWKGLFKSRLELTLTKDAYYVVLSKDVPLNIDEFKQLLSIMHQHFEHVLINTDTIDLIKELQPYRFTNTFRLGIAVDGNKFLGYDSVVTLHDIFPNVKIIFPIGKFTGEGFTLWKHLEELTLTLCFEFNFDCLEHILRELPLHTLQLKAFKFKTIPLAADALRNSPLSALILNSYELAYFTPQMKNLRHLQELHISDLYSTSNLDALNEELVDMRETHRITGISTRDIQVVFPRVIDLKLHSHLRRLLLTLDPMAFAEMLIYIPQLPTLRTLYFKSCYVRSKEDFEKLFAVSKHLDEISLEHCIFTYGSNPWLCASVLVENRMKPLTFNYFGNRFSNDSQAELKLTGRSTLFKLECKPKIARSYRYLHYEFSTSGVV